MSDKALAKRTMAEIKAESLGATFSSYTKQGKRRVHRTTLYNFLKEKGYEWSPKYQIWVHQSEDRGVLPKEMGHVNG